LQAIGKTTPPQFHPKTSGYYQIGHGKTTISPGKTSAF